MPIYFWDFIIPSIHARKLNRIQGRGLKLESSPSLSQPTVVKGRIYKILYILSLIFVACSILILWNNPILHYQLSPYAGIPVTAWVLLFIAFFLTGYALVSSQTHKTVAANRWFLIGLFMVILIAAVVLLFPYIRGAWFMEKGDVLSHVTLTGQILTDHHSTGNYYPPFHLLSASLVLITGMSAYTAITSLGILFYLLYILWVYCLAKVVLKDKIMIALAVIAAAAFPPGRIAAIPYYLSIMILPLVVTFYLTRHKSVSHSITCLLLLSLMVFFHPLTGLILMFCLLGIELFQRLQRTWARQNTLKQPMRTGTGYSAAALFSVGFLAWMVYENIFLFAGNVERFIEAITSVVTVSKYQHYLVDFPTLGITGMKFVDLFLRMYGDNIIFLALTLIAIFLIYKRSRSGAALGHEHRLFSLSGFIVVTGLVVVIALARPSGVIFSVPRLTFLLTVMTPIFAAYALYHICIYFKDKIIRRLHLIRGGVRENLLFLPALIVVSIVFIMMTLTIYPSPYIEQNNLQLMKSEIAGATWLLEHTNLEEDILGYDLGMNWRFVEVVAYLAGYYPAGYYPGTEHPYLYYGKLAKKLPDHMGYDSYDTVGDYIGSIQLPTDTGFILLDDGYVTLTRGNTMRLVELYAPLDWLNQSDLDRFYSDMTVNQVYSNYEYSAFWVPPSHR